jgi:hypothetical protein
MRVPQRKQARRVAQGEQARNSKEPLSVAKRGSHPGLFNCLSEASLSERQRVKKREGASEVGGGAE